VTCSRPCRSRASRTVGPAPAAAPVPAGSLGCIAVRDATKRTSREREPRCGREWAAARRGISTGASTSPRGSTGRTEEFVLTCSDRTGDAFRVLIAEYPLENLRQPFNGRQSWNVRSVSRGSTHVRPARARRPRACSVTASPARPANRPAASALITAVTGSADGARPGTSADRRRCRPTWCSPTISPSPGQSNGSGRFANQCGIPRARHRLTPPAARSAAHERGNRWTSLPEERRDHA
jgi:hypothetical protein